jgi:hypothetical protein
MLNFKKREGLFAFRPFSFRLFAFRLGLMHVVKDPHRPNFCPVITKDE